MAFEISQSTADLIYPRRIEVRRPNANTGIGLVSYSGLTQGSGESTIASNLPCNIQARGMGKVRGLGLLPGDAPGPAQWHVYLPANAAEKGSVEDRDVLVDDEGYRYQVSQTEWQIIGHKLVCIRLET